MLKLLLLIPILGCLPLIFIGGSSPAGTGSVESNSDHASVINRERTNSLMKNIALGTSLLNLFISIII
jgi:hypothetical protein